ncbi:MAG: hypothetical protein HQL20_10015 [Candidatus Omnitrophica bacterium]|nr:hypothetical protein [Candidatus Omnitrophota bacterium]
MPIEQGVQPLDALLAELSLTNADLVAVSTRQLSFKAVQKGRKGRFLTPNMKNKILTALRDLRPGRNFSLKDLFNY